MNKRKKTNRTPFYILKKLTVGFLCITLLTGCSSGIPIVSDSKHTQGYSLAESMIIIATERNRYEQVYTHEIWDVPLEDGTTFQTYLLDQIQTFLQSLRTMTLLAEDQGITLSSGEKDQLRRLSDSYYVTLTQDDLTYMGIRQEDVISLYQEYHLANKLVNELTKELDLEVSDSDAKVIDLQQIIVKDADTADQIYQQVMTEGSDFAAIAKSSSTSSQLELQMGRGEAASVLEEAAFALTAGDISPVISSDGLYYIFKCIDDYNEKATLERKTRIYTERKNQVFQQIYSQFQINHEIEFADELWSDITFSADDQTTTTNFFELYKKEFGGQSY